MLLLSPSGINSPSRTVGGNTGLGKINIFNTGNSHSRTVGGGVFTFSIGSDRSANTHFDKKKKKTDQEGIVRRKTRRGETVRGLANIHFFPYGE